MARGGMMVWAVLAATSATLLVACGDSFGSCADNRTCVSGGATGGSGEAAAGSPTESGGSTGQMTGTGGADAAGGTEAETAGAGGEPPAVACETSTDCDDGQQCNGLEECQDNFCVSGESPCANADPDNCVATCAEGATEPECGVIAADADHDDHGSTLCAAAPGDDCDDAHDTVYEGAPELCDGLDNDCDEAIDILDGLEFVYTSDELGDATSDLRDVGDVAWLEEKQVFGVVWSDGKLAGGPSVMFMAVKPDGTVTVAPKAIHGAYPILDLGASSFTPYRPRIAAGNGGFGVTWTYDAGVAFRAIAANGVAGAAVKLVATTSPVRRPDIAYSSAASKFALVWNDEGVTIDANNTASPINKYTLDSYNAPRIAALGDGFVIAGVNILIVSADLASQDALLLQGVQPTFPAVAAAGDRFGVVTTPKKPGAPEGAQPSFTAYDAAGNKLCGPVDVAVPGLLVTDIVAISTGYLLNFDYRYGVQEIGLDCRVGPPIVAAAAVDTNYNSALDGSDTSGYFSMAYNPETETLEYRQFGGNFCE